MKKTYKIALMIILFALALGIFIIYRIIFIPSGIDIDKIKYPITGIDVSNHSGKIDFQEAKNQNIDFVFMKSSEGEYFKDKTFEYNYNAAKKSGIPSGPYHFFRFNKPGKSQAINFLKSIKGKKFELPLVLDIEDWGNPTSKSKDEIIYEIGEFMSSVKMETGASPMIYTNENGYRKYISNSFRNNTIWICSFKNKPSIKGKWTFWQHSHEGKFDFADGLVDVNTFNGNKTDWIKYIGR
jgi:lysozyme